MTTELQRYRVFTVIDRRDEEPFWLNIGMAFPHKDGKGFNLRLEALPLRGRLVLRETDKDGKTTTSNTDEDVGPAK